MSDIFDAINQAAPTPPEPNLPLRDDHFSGLDRDPSVPARTSASPDLAIAGLAEFDLGAREDLRSIEVKLKSQTPLLPFAGENSQAGEQYRIIRTRILQHQLQPRSLAVSSAESGDGKSVNAVNLAGVLALNPDTEIILVDADLHRGSLARYFDAPVKPGLADVLSGTAALADCVVRAEPYSNLFFLPSGKGRGGPADMLNSKRWDNVAAALKRQFDFVIYDTPPAGAVADFDLIQANCDGVLLVARQDHTNRMLWMRALESIPDNKLIGVIMNCVKPWFLGRGYGYYQYYNYSKYYRRT